MTPDDSIQYRLVTKDGFGIASGNAKEIIEVILHADPDMRGIGIKKKPVVFWKLGLTSMANDHSIDK